MKYLVRDGSTGTLVHGYWCVEVYAHLPHKRILPLALEVYSFDDPAVGSQNLPIERMVRAVHDAGTAGPVASAVPPDLCTIAFSTASRNSSVSTPLS